MARANALAAAPPANVKIERRAHVEAVAAEGDALAVTLTGGRRVVVDEIVALTGYRPDPTIAAELAVELAPSTEGAGRLARAIADVTDCLSVPAVSAADLASGEPGFALVGHKSYGRSRAFLLQTGLAQLETIVAGLLSTPTVLLAPELAGHCAVRRPWLGGSTTRAVTPSL